MIIPSPTPWQALDVALAQFGVKGLTELTNLMGCYALLAFNVNAFWVELPAEPTETLPVSLRQLTPDFPDRLKLRITVPFVVSSGDGGGIIGPSSGGGAASETSPRPALADDLAPT